MPRYTPCADPTRSSYEIAEDQESIRFLPCGIRSWNPNDVEHRYCGLCHRYIRNSVDENTSPE